MSAHFNQTEPVRFKTSDWIVLLTGINLALLLAVCYLLCGISESWWFGTVVTYAPHAPLVVPTIVLLIASALFHRGLLGINLISLMIGIFPVMGLILPEARWTDKSESAVCQRSLKIVSCNVQEFKPDFSKVLEEIIAIDPDIVALQEALTTDELLEQHFRDWYKIHEGNFWVGSRYPLSRIRNCEVTQFGGRLTGIVVEVQTPGGTIVLATVHQMTARHGLTELNKRSLIDGDGTRELESFENERYFESLDLRAAVNSARGDRPLIVCGDFNTPVTSSLFQKHWGDLKSSFDVAGFGFGYTAPCKGNRFWPDNVPWARIDHILCSDEFAIFQSHIGHSNGSDHRLITSTLALNATDPSLPPTNPRAQTSTLQNHQP